MIARAHVALFAALLASIAAPGAAQEGIELRPIDRATVRIVALQGATPEEGTHRLDLRASHGSGAIVDRAGWVLTAAHVVQGADYLVVVRPGEDRGHPARVAYVDEDHDLAIVRFLGENDAVLTIGHGTRLQLGQTVQASGYPLDPRERWPAATSGQIGRPLNDGRVQLSISVNPGNSGGPIVVNDRTLVGIVSMGADPQRGAQGIAIMEPIASIVDRLRTAMAEGAAPPANESIASDILLEQVEARLPPELAARVERLRAADTQELGTAALLAIEAHSLMVELFAEAGARGIESLDAERRAAWDVANQAVERWTRVLGSGDPALAARYAIAPVAAAQGAVPVSASSNVVGPTMGPSPFAPVPVYTEDRPQLFTFGLLATLGMDIDDAPNASAVDGGEGGIAVSGRLAIMHFDYFRTKLVFGGDLALGGWRGFFSLAALGTVGLRFEVGPRDNGVFVEGLYTPGFVTAELRDRGVFAGYRVSAGVQIGMLEIGVSWRELGRSADSTLRTLLVTGGVELP